MLFSILYSSLLFSLLAAILMQEIKFVNKYVEGKDRRTKRWNRQADCLLFGQLAGDTD